MQQEMRAGPATEEACPTLAEDLLRGADAIALFVCKRDADPLLPLPI